MKKKILLWAAVLAVLLTPCQEAFAASVTFTNFSCTTIPNVESLKYVTSKEKADNEQNWYFTLTSSSNLGSTSSNARLLATSNVNDNSMDLHSQLLPVYSSMPAAIVEYHRYVAKGTNCNLYVTGDQNCAYSYHVTISGRYTS